MRADIAAEGVRLLDGGRHLLERELQAVERIVGRGDAARHHDLDLVAALAHLLAHRLAHLGDAVGDAHGERQGVAAMAARAEIGAAAAVAVAAGGADARLPAMNSRGPGNSPLSVASFRPQSAPPVSRTLVKPRSSILRIRRGGARRHQRQRHVFHGADHDLGQHHMDMAVDQAGHQRAPAAVDHTGGLQA